MSVSVSSKHKRLAILLRSVAGPFRVVDAVHALGLERSKAAKLLAAWHKQGAIRRVAQGIYVPISPAALGQDQVLEDPWLLVPELYEPGYIGGWSALEHWELTEQLFRSVCVLTAKRIPRGDVRHQGANFFVKRVPMHKVFGTKSVWRDSQKIQISDPHKTILDIVDDPKLGAGLQHTMDAMNEYRKISADNDSLAILLDYAEQTGVGALFKKLGYLGEHLHFPACFVEACAQRLTSGYAHLDKSAKKEKLVTKWRLWVPEGIVR